MAIGAAMRPFTTQQALLLTIPGVDALTAAAIIAEIGVDTGFTHQIAAVVQSASRKCVLAERHVIYRAVVTNFGFYASIHI